MATQIILTVDPSSTQFIINDAVPAPAGNIGVVNPTGNYTLLASDSTVISGNTAGSATTFTLPAASTVPGKVYTIVNPNYTAGGVITLSQPVRIDNATTYTNVPVQTQIEIQSDGTQWWQVSYKPLAQALGITEVSANYALQSTDDTVINTLNTATVITFTLPTGANLKGKTYCLVNANATAGGTVTLSPAVQTSNGVTTASMAIQTRMKVQYDGTTWWQID